MKKKILLSILLISCCCYVFTQSCESIGLYEKLQPTKKKGVQFPYKDQFEVTNIEGKSIRLFQNVDEIIEILGEPDTIDLVFKNPAENKEDYDILELVYNDGLRCLYYRGLKNVFRIILTTDKYFLSDDKICINHFTQQEILERFGSGVSYYKVYEDNGIKKIKFFYDTRLPNVIGDYAFENEYKFSARFFIDYETDVCESIVLFADSGV